MSEQEHPKISALFPNQASAAPLPADPEVINELRKLLAEAESGKCIGVCIVAFSAHEESAYLAVGKVTWQKAVADLERLKFTLLFQQGPI